MNRKPLIPNQETIEAIEAADRGELTTIDSLDNLLAELNSYDEEDLTQEEDINFSRLADESLAKTKEWINHEKIIKKIMEEKL